MERDSPVNLGERLKAIRSDVGEDQKTMSRRFGLGETTWQRLELQGRAPKGEVLAQLVDMGFSADWLLTGAGSMRRVAPPGLADSPEQPQTATPIDLAVLEEATEVMETLLAEFRRKMDARTKAKAIARIYEYLVTQGEAAEATRTAEVIRLFREAG